MQVNSNDPNREGLKCIVSVPRSKKVVDAHIFTSSIIYYTQFRMLRAHYFDVVAVSKFQNGRPFTAAC